MKLKLIFIGLITIVFVSVGFGQSKGKTNIFISSGRNFSNFEPANPEAGEDISNLYTTSQALINLSITTFGNYRITVRKEDTNWNNNLKFYIRRTGNGTPNGFSGNYISGGLNYLLLSNFEQTFFEGRYSRSRIPIQYEFRNLSVLIPADDYRTTVVYTITSQ